MDSVEIIEFNGFKYRRMPNGYYNAENWKDGPTMLHRAVWEHHNGPIPDGWHVHHVDFDHTNNDITNLLAMPAEEHLSLHAKHGQWVGSEANIEQLKKAGELAKAWHSSPEGLAWHSENSKRAWERRAWVPVKCQEPDCDREFDTPYPTRAKYCCGACKERSRRRAAGLPLGKRRKHGNDKAV